MSLAFNLVLYQVLMFLIPVLVILYVIIPACLNAVNGDGFWQNVKAVNWVLGWVFRKGTAKRTY